MTQYTVVKLKESKTLREDMEEILNDRAREGWEFIEMERAHRAPSLFFLMIFKKD